jgi:hypothetical protein
MRYALALLAIVAAGQPARIQNAKLETRSAAGGLEGVFRSITAATTSPAWIAYSVPISEGDHHMCGWQSSGKMLLEGAKDLVVLYRVEEHEMKKLRLATDDCEIDAGGLTVYWLTGVRPAESIALLKTFPSFNQTVNAIGLHNDPAAVPALISIAQGGTPLQYRKQAINWLGRSKDPKALEYFGKVLSK